MFTFRRLCRRDSTNCSKKWRYSPGEYRHEFRRGRYDGVQTQFSYRGHSRFFASVSYTLSKATNTTEPDGNGIGPNQAIISRLGEEERGPSVVDQRHRAVITVSYRFPWGFTAGTLSQF